MRQQVSSTKAALPVCDALLRDKRLRVAFKIALILSFFFLAIGIKVGQLDPCSITTRLNCVEVYPAIDGVLSFVAFLAGLTFVTLIGAIERFVPTLRLCDDCLAEYLQHQVDDAR